MNPYKELGIRKNASKATIKKAYRSKAKIHHPDNKGDPETFHKLREAYQVLMDPDRRKKYDETGKIDPENIDQTLTRALELIGNGFIEIMKMRNYDENFDYLGTLINTTKVEIEKVTIEISKNKGTLKQIEKILKRSKLKKKAKLKINVFAGAIANHKEIITKTLAQLEDRQKIMNKAYDILNDLEYERDSNPDSLIIKTLVFGGPNTTTSGF